MTDAYTHLDLTCADPISDMKSRMALAGIESALAVETWNGANLLWLLQIIALRLPEFRVALCFRPDQGQSLPELLLNREAVGLRVRTSDLRQVQPVAGEFAASGKWLVAHAENGIGPLAKELFALANKAPGLQIFLPHLGWPRQNKVDDPNWRAAITELQMIPGMVAGVSALAHFSREPFPHQDVEPLARTLIETFGPASVVAASDYPLFEKGMYAEYMQLAQTWIHRSAPGWSPRFERLMGRGGTPASEAGG